MSTSPFSTVFRKDLFKGKIAIVTGGATGIGFAIGKELAYLGCTVIIASRSKKQPNKLQKSADKINEFLQVSNNNNNKCIAVKIDVRSSKSIENFFKELSEKHNIKTIDYIINNAGGQYMSLLHDISEKGWKTVIDLNLNGIFLLSKYVLNKFWKNNKNNNDKVIINITANSFNGMPMMGHSSVARAGVENLTMVMTQNWSKYGVRINSVAPGFIDSSGLESYPKGYRSMLAIHTKDNYLYRMGTVQEVSNAVVFLLSDGASFITGASLRVDGGESIYNPLLPPTKPRYKPSKL
eukprot:369774_1